MAIMSTKTIPLTRYLLEQEARRPELGTEFCMLMTQLANAGKFIARDITRGAITGTGFTGEHNASGEEQQKLDVLSNDAVVNAFARTGLVSDIISEEMDEPHHMAGGANAPFVLCIDPLDGSSNIEVNGALGSIFAIYRRPANARRTELLQLLRRGSDQVAAGYILYGPATTMVYTSRAGVHAFTLDPELGQYLLSRSDMRCPPRGKCFGANLGNLAKWPAGIRNYVQYVSSKDAPGGKPYSLRYSGAFVADIHRILIAGGIFFYPAEIGQKSGKLRLLYECNPMALLVEQAGGRAIDGPRRILDLEAESIHQRSGIAIGSAEDVTAYEKFFLQGEAA
jgi:fructose-1,6-bisphosphatase I